MLMKVALQKTHQEHMAIVFAISVAAVLVTGMPKGESMSLEHSSTFPADVKLLGKLRQQLVQSAKDSDIALRQDYNHIC